MTRGVDLAAVPRRPLVTERLLLDAPAPDDAAAVVALAGNLDVSRWLGRVPHPYGAADAAHFLAEIAPRHLAFAVRRRADGAFMGIVGISPAEGEPPELGYWLGAPFWGEGYASEAARAVVRHAFADVGLDALSSGYFEGNERSARVLEKLGFRVVGRSLRPVLSLGREAMRIDMRLDAPPRRGG